jgi:Lon protease-like protein
MVPVFPLPNVVLFPKALLPLKIFEPRYRTMLKDVLDSHGRIAMALFKPGWETEYFGSPEVFSMVGVGRVLDYRPAQGGTYRIVLLGERRARIEEWVEGRPYRQARVAEVEEEEPPEGERERLRQRLRRYLDRLTRGENQVDDEVRAKIDEAVSRAEELGYLVDSIAFHFLGDPREKQALLEAKNALERERLLNEFLARHFQLGQNETDPPDTRE